MSNDCEFGLLYASESEFLLDEALASTDAELENEYQIAIKTLITVCEKNNQLTQGERDALGGLLEYWSQHANLCNNVLNKKMGEQQKRRDIVKILALDKVLNSKVL